MSNIICLPFIVKNGKLLKTTIDSGKFLSESKRGAYTGARTIKTKSGEFFVFNLKQHINRLTNSCQIMINDNFKKIPKNLENLTNENFLKEEIIKNLKEGFLNDSTKEDLKLTILITWSNEESYDLSIHFSKLTENISENVQKSIELIPGSRQHILAKDSEWVRYRKQIEDLRYCKTSNEIVLIDKQGNANEGLSSNFFVLMNDNKIYTANEGIIPGTVRTLILEICKEEKIEVILKSPNLNEIKNWKEIFIASTSRLLLPIEKLFLHKTEKFFDGIFDEKEKEEEKEKEKIFKNEIEEFKFSIEFSKKLSKKVKENLLKMSEKIF